jgi:phage terminase large subunit GpA-like protein
MADVTWAGKLDKRGVMIHHVGTVGAKHWLYGRLSVDAEATPENRVCHLSDEFEPSYFAGLVSETYDPRANRFVKRRGARNEPLDTWVYAFAAAHHPELRLHRRTRADWERVAAYYTKGGQPVDVLAPVAAPRPESKPKPPVSVASSSWSSRL